MSSSLSILPTLLLFLTTTSTITATTHASPVTPSTKCTPTNLLTNPSFESSASDITPWLSLATGSFSTRTLTRQPSGGHNSPTAYFASCNGSADVLSTLTLSQSYIDAPAGQTVDCYAWIKAGKRATGSTRVQVFLDEASCGGPVELGPDEGKNGEGDEESWTKVGGKVVVSDASAGGVGHTVAVTVQGYGVQGNEGWNVTIDDVGIVVGC